MVIGSSVSLFVETLQVYDVSRFPSVIDWLTNTAGTLIGAVFAVVLPQVVMGPLDWMGIRVRRAPAAAMLFGLWLLCWTFPFLPLLSPYQWHQKLREFMHAGWPFSSLIGGIALYMAVGVLARDLSRRHAALMGVLAVVLIPLQVTILGRQPILVDFVSAGIGLALFYVLRDHPRYLSFAFAAMLVAILLRGLEPFSFSMVRAPFEWKPLIASLRSEWSRAVFILMEKAAWYGTAVFLGFRSGRSLPRAAAIVAVLLAGIEVVQMWLPGRTPESTDPLLALGMAALIGATGRSRR